MAHRPIRRSITLLAAAAALLPGCLSGPDIAEEPYRGPEITASRGDRFYEVTVQSPSPGWRVEFDRSERTADGRDVFVTLRRPDPQFLYPQVISEQTRLTDVRTESNIRVLARVVDHDASGRGGTYREVEGPLAGVGPQPPQDGAR